VPSVLVLLSPAFWCCLFLFRLLFTFVGGHLARGRFDLAVDHALLSASFAKTLLECVSRRLAVVQARYQGTFFTTDVGVDIADIDCDLIVGCEWVSFWHLVD
jgi:hypothetical protein